MASSERKKRAAAPAPTQVGRIGATGKTEKIRKLLIANRGEIACRIIRTCRALGIRTVAVYSDVDARAQHVTLADEAIALGGNEAKESYLAIPKILQALKTAGADAVHPGYGFLSENAAFVDALDAAHVRFVGPPAAAMRSLGDKLAAKDIAKRVKAPTAPTLVLKSATDRAGLEPFMRTHGFPLLVKAAGGGGGRGMRVVSHAAELESLLAQASREAESFFADGRVFLEKLVTHARHIEVQVLGDTHGTVIAVGDRDCTAQRRHQKCIEEAPAAEIPDATRAAMHKTAIALCEAAGYVSAGTVEFLLDRTGAFYFLEVNSRLQVEHPVTEAVTGLDLVELQLRIAQGEKLSDLLPGGTPAVRGHAIEARLCAEVPEANFAASTGRLVQFTISQQDGVRVDAGFRSGDTITHYYDSLLAKVIVHAADRETARQRLTDALWDATVEGLRTNTAFLLNVLQSDPFKDFSHYTKWIDERPAPDATHALHHRLLAAAIFLLHERAAPSPNALSGWRLFGTASIATQLRVDDTLLGVTLRVLADGTVAVSESASGTVLTLTGLWRKGPLFSFQLGVVRGRARVDRTLGTVQLASGTAHIEEVVRSAAGAQGDGKELTIRATLPGKIVGVNVKTGDQVNQGDALLVLESMKMEHPVRATEAARVVQVSIRAGEVVEARAPLMVLAPLASS